MIFLIGSAGTVAGAFLAYGLLNRYIPGLSGVAAMMTGSYIGGGVNFAALALEFDVGEIKASATVADNLLMALYFFALLIFAGLKFFRSRYTHPHIDAVEAGGDREGARTQAAAYWSRKDISLKDIAFNFAYSVAVVWAAKCISALVSALIPDTGVVLHMLNTFFGSEYVWITTVAMAVATWGEKQVAKLHGSQEIGTYLIYLFLFVIGVPASVSKILTETPLLLAFTGIMVVVNMLFCFVGGKLLHFDLEDIILASNANIGGPTTAAGMAISQGSGDAGGYLRLCHRHLSGDPGGYCAGSLNHNKIRRTRHGAPDFCKEDDYDFGRPFGSSLRCDPPPPFGGEAGAGALSSGAAAPGRRGRYGTGIVDGPWSRGDVLGESSRSGERRRAHGNHV